MARPLIFRLRQLNISKRNKHKDSGNDVYFQLLLKFHDNILSIVKSLFVCLFVFAATPIAILAGSDFKKYKGSISEITSMIGEMMVYCLLISLLYVSFVICFDLKSRRAKYLTERLKYMNKTMSILAFIFVIFAMFRSFALFSSILEKI